MEPQAFIQVKGAREHNLKSIDVNIPRDRFVVVTGVSGSGKSSLAFDTIYAEAYRKYMDSLSLKARQWLDQVRRPDVDYIHGLSPVISMAQHAAGNAHPRATVGTVTEVIDYARLLWALCGDQRCPKDGGRVVQRSLDDCVDRILALGEGIRAMILAPYMEAKTSVLRGELPHLRQRGFTRLRVNGRIVEIDDAEVLPGGTSVVTLEVVVDRVVVGTGQRARLSDSLELAFKEGTERAIVLYQDDDDGSWKELPLGQHRACELCGTVYPALDARSFSFNHPRGACDTCGGLGETMQFSESLLVPDPEKSIKNGAIKPLRLGSKRMIIRANALLKQLSEQMPFDPNTPWQELPEEQRHMILYGTGERAFSFKLQSGHRKPEVMRFEGVLAELERIRRETTSDGLRARLMSYQVRSECPACRGRRLKPEVLSVYLNRMDFATFSAMNVEQAHGFVRAEGERMAGSVEAVKEILISLERRLHFLGEVGVGYLGLDRAYSTLSGGEAQRALLASQLGMGLVGVLYVLDEPTVGLHPHDTGRLLATLGQLRASGNSLIVVEHDPDTIRQAEHLIELGPGAGEAGGHLVFAGTVEEAIEEGSGSRTGAYLSGRAQVEPPLRRAHPGRHWISITGAHEHNLKEVDVRFPVGLLTVVTGLSGSGKSTLVNSILGNYAAQKLNGAKAIPGRHRGITGLEAFTRAVRVDQDPIGRSPRSNPATYVKIFDELRKLYAQSPLARVRGYTPGRFSFNVTGGRCERCAGDGAIRLDMQFLTDAFVECPSCAGKRYNRETLEVRYRGFSIADVLDLTVDEAVAVFAKHPKILTRLEVLRQVGLGYIRLGQPANTLSGGEAQRIKLSLELSKGRDGNTLYLLDEPTVGLHWDDVQLLLNALFELREQGNTLIVIEHNTDVIRLADYVVDLGPGGGEHGGELLFAGTPQDLLGCERSLTGQCLRREDEARAEVWPS